MTIIVDKYGGIKSSIGTKLLQNTLENYGVFSQNIFEIFNHVGVSTFDVKYLQDEMNNLKILGCTFNIRNNNRSVLINFITEPITESEIKFNIQSIISNK